MKSHEDVDFDLLSEMNDSEQLIAAAAGRKVLRRLVEWLENQENLTCSLSAVSAFRDARCEALNRIERSEAETGFDVSDL